MLEELNEEENNNSPYPSETVRYLTTVENKLYDDIILRKRIDSGLFFLAMQVSSCSISWVLFHLQVTLSIIQLVSFCVSCLPGLMDVGDGFGFSLSSESWEFTLGQKPMVGVIKLGIGIGVSLNGTAKISKEILNTRNEIRITYKEIQDNNNWQVPNMEISLLVTFVGIALLGIIKKITMTRGKKEND